MDEAYALRTRVNPDVLLGGVAIPERHQSKGDEHLRVFHKVKQGCSFFVSQGVYDVNAAKIFYPNTIIMVWNIIFHLCTYFIYINTVWLAQNISLYEVVGYSCAQVVGE